MSADRWQLLPDLSTAEFAALKADVAAHGVAVPIEVDAESGAVLDGLRAVEELRAEGVKVPDWPRIVRSFATDDERVEHVLALNLARRHLSTSARRDLAAELRGRGWSLRRIGEAVGVGVATVHGDLAGVRDRTPARVEGADHKRYPARRPAVIVGSARQESRARAALSVLGEDAPGGLLDVRKAEEKARVVNVARRRAEHAGAAGSTPSTRSSATRPTRPTSCRTGRTSERWPRGC
jgi:ParB-like chromosome segregation protein Spo0J